MSGGARGRLKMQTRNLKKRKRNGDKDGSRTKHASSQTTGQNTIRNTVGNGKWEMNMKVSAPKNEDLFRACAAVIGFENCRNGPGH